MNWPACSMDSDLCIIHKQGLTAAFLLFSIILVQLLICSGKELLMVQRIRRRQGVHWPRTKYLPLSEDEYQYLNMNALSGDIVRSPLSTGQMLLFCTVKQQQYSIHISIDIYCIIHMTYIPNSQSQHNRKSHTVCTHHTDIDKQGYSTQDLG